METKRKKRTVSRKINQYWKWKQKNKRSGFKFRCCQKKKKKTTQIDEKYTKANKNSIIKYKFSPFTLNSLPILYLLSSSGTFFFFFPDPSSCLSPRITLLPKFLFGSRKCTVVASFEHNETRTYRKFKLRKLIDVT